MQLDTLQNIIKNEKLPNFRLKQLSKAIFQDGVSSFSGITTLPKQFREKLDKEQPILSFEVAKILKSADKQSAKALLKLTDGHFIESVLISPKPGLWSVCISCQVGCPLRCGFCATGAMGFKRNLTSEEITDQVLLWRQFLKAKSKDLDITNIVYMGMGEPFINWENVKDSLQNLVNKELFAFGSRSISVSTAGIAPGIEQLAKDFPQINLAISLHFATEEKRNKFMPVNKRFDMQMIKEALQKYFMLTKRKVFIEYVMLKGENDSTDDAKQLAEYLKSIGNVHLLHVNLIRYNETDKGCQPSSKETTMRFKDALTKYGISATIRKSLGFDIQGACGQLAGHVVRERHG